MDYLDFIKENYIWFIVGGIILIMTLIGYFAEKTNFGKKSEHKDKTEKKSKKTKKNKKDKNENEVEGDKIFDEESFDKFQNDDFISDNAMENNPIIEEVIEEPNIEEEPMENLDEVEIKEPTSVTEESEEIPISSGEKEEIPEELYAGLDGEPNAYKNMENEATEENIEQDGIDMDLPDIESLNSNVEEENLEDDDIWRF